MGRGRNHVTKNKLTNFPLPDRVEIVSKDLIPVKIYSIRFSAGNADHNLAKVTKFVLTGSNKSPTGRVQFVTGSEFF